VKVSGVIDTKDMHQKASIQVAKHINEPTNAIFYLVTRPLRVVTTKACHELGRW